MASENGDSTYHLKDDLLRRSHELDFYQIVRKLECQSHEGPRVGCSIHPQEDVVRFCQNVSLAFAPSSVSSYTISKEKPQGQLWVNFMGLLGSHGPMPLYLTDYIRGRKRNFGDSTLDSFFNLFNHRMISLFYKAWASCQKAVSFDRPQSDQFGQYIACLAGINLGMFSHNEVVGNNAKLYYSGRFLGSVRNKEGLESILQDYFQVRVRLKEYVGEWVDIPRSDLFYMVKDSESGYLGRTTVIGSRVWECQHKFRLIFGPLSLSQYQRFLPGQKNISHLTSWVNNYVGSEFKWDVQLILCAREIPQSVLGRYGQLGYTTWLGRQRHSVDADQLVLTNCN
jgi:type VI secretion system protein ImpH